jgi:predicted CXXCH cytochrome family protein
MKLAGGFLLLCLPMAAQTECASCHPKIAAIYAQTGMARSFRKMDPSVAPTVFLHKRSETSYSMIERDGKIFQRRWRQDPDGKEIHVRELSVDYIMGSGNHARSFLHRTPRGALLELPLAWYPENGGTWAMSPGHDRDYSLPPRAVAYECMFCHNGYPSIPPGHEESGAEPLYADPLPQGIDCRRCHGPGAKHIARAQSGKSSPEEIRSAIVNPARLPGDRQMEVCMQCHLETTALPLPHSLLKIGRGPFSYNPAEPLGDFMNFFDHAPGSKYADDFEIAHSAYRLRKSRCFIQSAGKMTCTTCHDPHDASRGEQAKPRYNGVCANCHASLPASHTTSPDCVSCHMPKRRTEDVIHAAMTDHFIQRHAPVSRDLTPHDERAEFDDNQYRGEVVPYYPLPGDPLLNAIAQVTQKSNLTRGLPRLAAEIARQRPAHPEPYIELGQAWLAAGRIPSSIGAFEEALRRKPESIAAVVSLGDVLTQSGQVNRAVALLTRATQVSADEPLVWYQLGLAQAKAGRETEARAALSKAAALDPDMAEVHNILGSLLAGRGDTSAAESEFQTALEINPDLPEALGNLGQLLGLRGSLTSATFYLGRSIKLRPAAVDVRINYSVALASLALFDEAEKQIDEAIRLAPGLPNVHYIKASILEKRGQPAKALTELETALRLRPDYAAAHLAAARILKAKGDAAGAAMHLRLAQASSSRSGK